MLGFKKIAILSLTSDRLPVSGISFGAGRVQFDSDALDVIRDVDANGHCLLVTDRSGTGLQTNMVTRPIQQRKLGVNFPGVFPITRSSPGGWISAVK